MFDSHIRKSTPIIQCIPFVRCVILVEACWEPNDVLEAYRIANAIAVCIFIVGLVLSAHYPFTVFKTVSFQLFH